MTYPDRSAWIRELLSNLEGAGPEGQETLRFIQQRRTRVSIHEQPTGARWTIDRRIEIHPRYAQASPDDTYALSLIIHEVRHLQQGMLIALSVYGELEAWQLQFRYIRMRLGRYHEDAQQNARIGQLIALKLGWDRVVLEGARKLMQAYAGVGYRVDLLPLYPMPAEIVYRVSHKQPADKYSQN